MDKILVPLKALADGNRLRVVAALLACEELCVCQITELLGIATGTVSRHMSILQAAQLVASRKDGRWVFYSLHGAFPERLRTWLDSLLTSSDILSDDNKRLAEILACPPDDLCRKQRATGRMQARAPRPRS